MSDITICDLPRGRLGNAIFRYLSSTIFLLNYSAKRVFDKNVCQTELDDKYYLNWKNDLLYNNIKQPLPSGKYLFAGYYQHDDILKKYKTELIEYIKQNPEHLLITSDYDRYKALNIITIDKPINKYKIVFHLRLEDFISYDLVMNPQCLIKLLDNYKNEQICFVVNKITSELEQKYIDFFTKKYNIVIESNDVITDYHILKNAKVLCCSCSTLSWIAAFFSETVEVVYFPNYNNPHRIHETFKNPIDNTILYEFSKCTQKELIKILDNKI